MKEIIIKANISSFTVNEKVTENTKWEIVKDFFTRLPVSVKNPSEGYYGIPTTEVRNFGLYFNEHFQLKEKPYIEITMNSGGKIKKWFDSKEEIETFIKENKLDEISSIKL